MYSKKLQTVLLVVNFLVRGYLTEKREFFCARHYKRFDLFFLLLQTSVASMKTQIQTEGKLLIQVKSLENHAKRMFQMLKMIPSVTFKHLLFVVIENLRVLGIFTPLKISSYKKNILILLILVTRSPMLSFHFNFRFLFQKAPDQRNKLLLHLGCRKVAVLKPIKIHINSFTFFIKTVFSHFSKKFRNNSFFDN